MTAPTGNPLWSLPRPAASFGRAASAPTDRAPQARRQYAPRNPDRRRRRRLRMFRSCAAALRAASPGGHVEPPPSTEED
jgi:hypothetical protein